jgi:outer membrane protein TolC
MNKLFICFISIIYCFNNVNAQTDLNHLLKQIEQNNHELKTYKSLIEAQKLRIKSDNKLPNLDISGYYLPFGNNNGINYTEFEISQSFEFPTVYGSRNEWNTLKNENLDYQFLKKRQEILLKATNCYINLYILQKKKIIEEKRNQQGQKVYQQITELFAKEQVGVLDVNKAKLVWLQEQFNLEQINSTIKNELTLLESLNGNTSINNLNFELNNSLEIEKLEQIWLEKEKKDISLLQLISNEKTALQKIKLEKNKTLPNLSFGYNYQGINSDNYSGFYGGLSIPLWKSKTKVTTAKTDYQYAQLNTQSTKQKLYSKFKQNYLRYKTLYQKYAKYEQTLNNLNSENLLFKAYQLGELSYLEYYMEIKFLRDALDKKIALEKELQQLKTQLYIHNL